MAMDHADDLLAFLDVRVVRSTAPALLCQIGGRSVWLPRAHISGKLWGTGDRGKLFIPRSVARDRLLIDLHGAPVSSVMPLIAPSHLPVRLHLVRRDGDSHHAEVGVAPAKPRRTPRSAHPAPTSTNPSGPKSGIRLRSTPTCGARPGGSSATTPH
jgi:hypothetical protein